MEILVACPADCATGGPEALHAFTHLLCRNGADAKIWYREIKTERPCPADYERYRCEYVTEVPPDFDGVIIFPEIWANDVVKYQCRRAIYWLGVDAYAGWTPTDYRGAFLSEDVLHIAQSDYAKDFLKKLGVEAVKCTDMLNADFYRVYEENERSDIVLYNPAKTTPFQRELMAACPEFQYQPIKDMTRAEVIQTMRHSKLYLDFGEFPGRERMPREAVLCGCCIITSKTGAAGYDGDFLHHYKFESKPSHIWAIKRKMHEVLDNYDRCRKDFDAFREDLRTDRLRVNMQVGKVINAL